MPRILAWNVRMVALKIAYFDCFAGISGDMTLAALVDAGADFERLKSELEKLAVKDYELKLDKVVKHGITASDVTVEIVRHHHHHGHSHGHEHHHHGRSFSEIRKMIEESGLSESVKRRAVAVFRKLGEAEAKIHGKSIEEIHFHEVGAVDSIVDIVGACIGLDLLGVERIYSSPLPTFHGMVQIAHGTFPLPAPATSEILKGVPWRELGLEGEIVTPTGAAIIAELSEGFGPMPAMTTQSIGYGAGKKDFGMPNVLRIAVGETGEEMPQQGGEHTSVQVIETNIDDLNPQAYDMVMEKLFAAGALDVYLMPIHMKKNRPAVLLSVICAPEDSAKMADIIFEETSSIGVRISTQSRLCLARRVVTVETPYGQVRIKVAEKDGKVVNAQPEYEDCRAAAVEHNVPLKRVLDVAVAEYIMNEG